MSNRQKHGCSSVCLHAGGGFTWSDEDVGFNLSLSSPSSICWLSSQCLTHKHRKEHAEALDTDAIKKPPYLQAMTCTKAHSLEYDLHIYTRHSEKPAQLYVLYFMRCCTILQIQSCSSFAFLYTFVPILWISTANSDKMIDYIFW